MADLPVGKDRRVGRLGGVESFDVVGVYAISETQLLSDMICNRMASRMQTATAVNTLQLKLAINRKEKKKLFIEGLRDAIAIAQLSVWTS